MKKREKQIRCYLDKLKILLFILPLCMHMRTCDKCIGMAANKKRTGMETGYEEKEDEQNEMQQAWPCTTFIGGLAPNRRAFHSSPSHTPHPTPHLILSTWLAQHFPDITPSHHLQHCRGNPGHLSQPQPPPDSLDISASILATYRFLDRASK